MKSFLVFFISFISYQFIFGQETQVKNVDSLYKEDQFYFGLTYNALISMPEGMSQNGFSSGFHLGFIKDIPINKKRNWALGIGLGFSTNTVNHNLLITKEAQGNYNYELLESSQFTKNKFSRQLIEIPFELRWRTSTPESYKFWRVYSGFKLGYVFASKTRFTSSSENIKQTNIENFDKIQYGLSLGIGYNTWNAYVYYALNPIFKKEAKLNGESIDIRAVKIGLMFYIL
jgi:Outer membrane protein beta-barrel domain